MRKNPEVVGIYRLTMKSGSDNFRASAMSIKNKVYTRDLYSRD